MDLLLSPTSKVLNKWFEVAADLLTLSNFEVIVFYFVSLGY